MMFALTITILFWADYNKECLGDRLIDAFYWFGDASRDNNSSAQVVKLVTAMERLVTVKNEEKNGDITKKLL